MRDFHRPLDVIDESRVDLAQDTEHTRGLHGRSRRNHAQCFDRKLRGAPGPHADRRSHHVGNKPPVRPDRVGRPSVIANHPLQHRPPRSAGLPVPLTSVLVVTHQPKSKGS